MKRTVTAVLTGLALCGSSLSQAAEIPRDLEIDAGSLTVSKKELVCLALNDYWESRGEPLEGRLAVAQVVLNRAMDERFPSNLCSVVFQYRHSQNCQFYWACTGKSIEPTDRAAWRESVLLASTVLDRQSGLQALTGGAKWFHATYVKPNWGGGLKVSRKIARHVFYREANADRSQGSEDFAEWSEDRLNDTQVATNSR